MLKQVTPVLLLLAVTTACSTPVDRRQANGSDEYAKVESAPLLVIPEGLNEPTYSKEYAIPELGNNADSSLVGKTLDIRPPLQVLPMAEGTHVEEGSDNIKIVVESIDNDVDLKEELFNVLKEYLNSKSVEIVNEDYEAGIIETGWIEDKQVIDSSFWGSDEVYVLRQRYQFDVDVRPHGRSGSLLIDLIEHEESFDGSQKEIFLSGEDKRRYTIDMLNNTVAYISVKRAQAIKAKRLKESLGIDVDLVKAEVNDDADSEASRSYWIADAPFKRTWDRLRIVLPELGFEIIDMDSNKGLYYINVTDDSGFWSSLWSEKKLPIDEGSYRLLLQDGDSENQTRIDLNNVDDEPLSNEVVEAVYDGLAELMSEDRKVR
ncbi:outer membrane protein assembly factor BamC [Shewanella sp. Scap07]|uniref:outer membrane protein assembly factor BamC n=1 Tax=Shewanella sp. Scap07 TaxID=2589987 RepID=UPI0015BFAF88|nr:outer membrane protein assembly factor BamC [Shewanella sp. Scap07]QLE85434.1 outer membrane protein assembly factor BamC [Shewanella sp. Scap07]